MSMSQPFNNAVPSPSLVDMWRNNLRKSRQEMPAPAVLPSVITINFDGAGAALTVGQAGLLEVTFACRILSCHMYAGSPTLEPVSVTASVDLRRGQQGAWASGAHPLYGTTMPSMTAQAESSPSTSGWDVELQPGDLIPYSLFAFSGSATWLTLSLPVRRLDERGIGESGVTDSGGAFVTDSTGARVVVRT